jgi:hypothetical protein
MGEHSDWLCSGHTSERLAIGSAEKRTKAPFRRSPVRWTNAYLLPRFPAAERPALYLPACSDVAALSAALPVYCALRHRMRTARCTALSAAPHLQHARTHTYPPPFLRVGRYRAWRPSAATLHHVVSGCLRAPHQGRAGRPHNRHHDAFLLLSAGHCYAADGLPTLLPHHPPGRSKYRLSINLAIATRRTFHHHCRGRAVVYLLRAGCRSSRYLPWCGCWRAVYQAHWRRRCYGLLYSSPHALPLRWLRHTACAAFALPGTLVGRQTALAATNNAAPRRHYTHFPHHICTCHLRRSLLPFAAWRLLH